MIGIMTIKVQGWAFKYNGEILPTASHIYLKCEISPSKCFLIFEPQNLNLKL